MLSLLTQHKWIYLLPSSATQGFVASNAIQAKEQSYHNRHLVDQFLSLRVEVF
jgi:hypothetical protein